FVCVMPSYEIFSIMCYHILCLCLITTPPSTPIHSLSLHDALPISWSSCTWPPFCFATAIASSEKWRSSLSRSKRASDERHFSERSEEHTSELQSQSNLVCRLLLEKKNKHIRSTATHRILALVSVHARQQSASFHSLFGSTHCLLNGGRPDSSLPVNVRGLTFTVAR